jgi:hypothetical protein
VSAVGWGSYLRAGEAFKPTAGAPRRSGWRVARQPDMRKGCLGRSSSVGGWRRFQVSRDVGWPDEPARSLVRSVAVQGLPGLGGMLIVQVVGATGPAARMVRGPPGVAGLARLAEAAAA